jgi:hypothetical protein
VVEARESSHRDEGETKAAATIPLQQRAEELDRAPVDRRPRPSYRRLRCQPHQHAVRAGPLPKRI